MHIRIDVENGEVVFRFHEPGRFDVFLVSDVARQIYWELKPAYMHRVDVPNGFLIGAAAAPRVAELLPRGNETPSAEEEAVPRVSEVKYGAVPIGYRELTSARMLALGKTYALLVFDDAGNSEVVHFSFP